MDASDLPGGPEASNFSAKISHIIFQLVYTADFDSKNRLIINLKKFWQTISRNHRSHTIYREHQNTSGYDQKSNGAPMA